MSEPDLYATQSPGIIYDRFEGTIDTWTPVPLGTSSSTASSGGGYGFGPRTPIGLPPNTPITCYPWPECLTPQITCDAGYTLQAGQCVWSGPPDCTQYPECLNTPPDPIKKPPIDPTLFAAPPCPCSSIPLSFLHLALIPQFTFLRCVSLFLRRLLSLGFFNVAGPGFLAPQARGPFSAAGLGGFFSAAGPRIL